MSRRIAFALAFAGSLALAVPALADPPDHAPAHGRRAKQKHHPHSMHHHRHDHRDRHDDRHRDVVVHGPALPGPGGFQVIFDPERGVSVAVGFPNVFFHEDHFYRMHSGAWQTSGRADGGWKPIAPHAAPEAIRRALPHPPAKHDSRR
jgi:hypothetical protein